MKWGLKEGILGLLGMYFDAAVVFVTNFWLFLRLAVAILWVPPALHRILICRIGRNGVTTKAFLAKLAIFMHDAYLLRIMYFQNDGNGWSCVQNSNDFKVIHGKQFEYVCLPLWYSFCRLTCVQGRRNYFKSSGDKSDLTYVFGL